MYLNNHLHRQRYRLRLVLSVSFVIFLGGSVLHADTTWVAGTVSGVWSRTGNPYLVTDTLTIPHDSTLQIMPGVQIYFQNQQIRRTPINVLGHLRAIGEEGDSVYFYSPVASFGGIDNEETPGTEIRLEYSVIDSTFEQISSFYGSAIIRHSRICGFLQLFTGLSDVDTIQYSIFHSYWFDECHIDFMGGSALFQNNWGPSIYLNSSGTDITPIFGNHIFYIYIGGGTSEIFNNSFVTVQCENNNSLWHNNEILGSCHVTGGNPIFEHSSFTGYIQVMSGNSLFRENEINGSFNLYECSATVLKNLIIATNSGSNYAVRVFSGGSNSIKGNSIIFDDNGIYALSASSGNQIIDNIFVGDGVNCTGVYSTSPNNFLIRYNDFYQVSTVTYNCQLGPGNILLDPYFRAGNPYDYQLQANSPCIDTGDPTSPLDPDGTRADMGCYFFDHRIDNPPAIISPTVVNVQRGTMLRYVARATDDYGPLTFGFWNLPPWLHQEPYGLDWVADSAAVSGQVPHDQQNFTFGVWVQDGSAQRDSQVVSVLVSQYTILAGEVTGVLTRERSPYMVVEDVVVPAGDSLTIEPGVEIRFQWEPVEDLRHRIVVRGKLHAVGTLQDTIRFMPEFGDSLEWAWRGIQCLNQVDTTEIRYAYLLNAKYAVQIDSGGLTNIKGTEFCSPYYGVYLNNNSWISIDSCDFRSSDCQWGHFIYVDSASATVANSHFEFPDTADYVTFFNYTNSATGTVSGCTFSGGGSGAGFNMSSHGDFIRNYTNGASGAIGYANGASGIFANNIRNGARNALLLSSNIEVLASNNLFYQADWGIWCYNWSQFTIIENNLFLYDSIGIYQQGTAPPPEYIGYNDFFANDTDYVNCIIDSTNIFVDPMVQDTINFQLSAGSSCIDTGDPDPFFNDVDSTRNDIGCWGGPWGESYPYVTVLSNQPKPIPTEFILFPPYPNPFNSVLVITFALPIQIGTTINIYNILGQKVQEYTFPPLSPGVHRVIWNAESYASGLYIIQLISGNQELKQKALLIK
jgi:hypothetical protein